MTHLSVSDRKGRLSLLLGRSTNLSSPSFLALWILHSVSLALRCFTTVACRGGTGGGGGRGWVVVWKMRGGGSSAVQWSACSLTLHACTLALHACTLTMTYEEEDGAGLTYERGEGAGLTYEGGEGAGLWHSRGEGREGGAWLVHGRPYEGKEVGAGECGLRMDELDQVRQLRPLPPIPTH